MWIAGKWYIPQQKSPRSHPGRINLRDVQEGMERVLASQNVSCYPQLATNRVPFYTLKKTVFREIPPLNGNFSGM